MNVVQRVLDLLHFFVTVNISFNLKAKKNSNLIFLDDGINAIRVKNGSIADGRKITVS